MSTLYMESIENVEIDDDVSVSSGSDGLVCHARMAMNADERHVAGALLSHRESGAMRGRRLRRSTQPTPGPYHSSRLSPDNVNFLSLMCKKKQILKINLR